MKKIDLIKAMEHIGDEEHVMIGEECFPYKPKIEAICGKGQMHMIYHCVLPINHSGECYCQCKNTEFTPD